MKQSILLLSLLFLSLLSLANKIDSLHTDNDVINFVQPLLPDEYRLPNDTLSFTLWTDMISCDSLCQTKDYHRWNKADFNNDGIEDLLVNVYEQKYHSIMVLAIIGSNKNDYKITDLYKWNLPINCAFGYSKQLNKTTSIIIKSEQYFIINKTQVYTFPPIDTMKVPIPIYKDTIIYDTVAYSPFGFIEPKTKHPDHKIEKIKIEMFTGAISDPKSTFTMNIDSTGLFLFDGHDSDYTDLYLKSVISSSKRDSLFHLLNYIDFTSLHDNYKVEWDYKHKATLTIIYDNDKVKKIEDYGDAGAYGLMKFYQILYDLRDNTNWESRKTKPKQYIYKDEIPTPTSYVNDYAGLFSDEQKDSLTNIISEHERQTTNEIAIVTFDTLMIPKDSFDSFTLHLGNQWGVGKKDKNNGILIAICLKMHTIRIQNGKGIEKKLSDSETKEIIDSIIIPEFKNGDFYEGTKKGVLAIIKKTT